MIWGEREEVAGATEVIVEVAGCGVCHTDLGFYYEGVPTRHPLPLTLGHEVSGQVVEAGDEAQRWLGRSVIVPAVMPCGSCEACLDGRQSICPRQIFPGNDVHGGFATHVRVPSLGLCTVPNLDCDQINPLGLKLEMLSVLADAVSTAYQAILRSPLEEAGLAIFVGAGGVGGFGVQIAASRGARVIAIDTDAAKLDVMASHGADLTLCAKDMDFRQIRGAVREYAHALDIPTWRQCVFETSGTIHGQRTAFGLLARGGYLSVVGYSPDKVSVRLANLMALDATAQGNWGCVPEHYPAVLGLVLSGQIKVEPFVEYRPLSTVNEVFVALKQHAIQKRVVLVPDR